MPAFSFHLPPFLRSHRSRHSHSPRPSPAGDDADAAHSSHLSDRYLPLPQRQNQGMFHQAQNLSVTGNFIDGNVGSVVYITAPSNQFMEKLLKETIIGAASDSSARHPPPRCHPGTRLAVLERCLSFITHCNEKQALRWVVGAAGVGKSAIMQSVTESPELKVSSKASVFFSINGRNDGTKAIITLAYQFAAKSAAYRQVIEDEIIRDPSLLYSSMPVQFEKFIVEPFMYNRDLNSAGRVLIVIDGLDECNDADTQIELLYLISNFCFSCRSSPIVWLIASRPETHITSFFSIAVELPAHMKEEILVDSDEARADVEQFLRAKLTEIGKASDFLGPHWPSEQQIWKLANAAGGLFAYAHTVIRYIGDSNIGDPASQLSDVLTVIDENPMLDVALEEHPMALLDALYTRILSKIPSKIMINTRKILLLLASDWDFALFDPTNGKNLIVLCNWLGMTANEVYAAVNRLRSVLYFPQCNEAHMEAPRPFHKSFIDYTSRSGFSSNIKLEAQQLKTRCAFRVLKEAPSGIDFGSDEDYLFACGILARNIGAGNTISTTWPVSEDIDWDDDQTRLGMYKLAIGEVVGGVKRGDAVFQSEFCIGVLTSRLQHFYVDFPHDELRNLVFDESRRHEYIKSGILKQIPLKAVVNSRINNDHEVKLQFRRPVTTMTLSDPWDSSCFHARTGQHEQGKEQHWTTTFKHWECFFCVERLERQLNSWIIRSPDHVVLILFTSTEECCVELRYVDPEDGGSEWSYWWWIKSSLEERRELGSVV